MEMQVQTGPTGPRPGGEPRAALPRAAPVISAVAPHTARAKAPPPGCLPLTAFMGQECRRFGKKTDNPRPLGRFQTITDARNGLIDGNLGRNLQQL